MSILSGTLFLPIASFPFAKSWFFRFNAMAPNMAPGEPREGNKPQPLGNFGLIFILTTSTLCLLYLLWRRASALRAVVSHQYRLKTWTRTEGQIRLSEDDGPSAAEFLVDADDEDDGTVDNGVILSREEERLRTGANAPPSDTAHVGSSS